MLVAFIDKRDFSSVGEGVWWAIQTLTTVGYGDIVPTTTWGRVVASFVIVFGVTAISFITAAVTSAFVSAGQEARENEERERADDERRELYERLERIEHDLEDIKRLLGGD